MRNMLNQLLLSVINQLFATLNQLWCVLGPCLLAAGAMCLFLSGEVCLRLYKQTKKVLDPDLDNIANPHEVKHWMDPRLIPFGWGLFDIDDEVIVIEKGRIFINL